MNTISENPPTRNPRVSAPEATTRALLEELAKLNPIVAALQGAGFSLVEVVEFMRVADKAERQAYEEALLQTGSTQAAFLAQQQCRLHMTSRLIAAKIAAAL